MTWHLRSSFDDFTISFVWLLEMVSCLHGLLHLSNGCLLGTLGHTTSLNLFNIHYQRQLLLEKVEFMSVLSEASSSPKFQLIQIIFISSWNKKHKNLSLQMLVADQQRNLGPFQHLPYPIMDTWILNWNVEMKFRFLNPLLQSFI